MGVDQGSALCGQYGVCEGSELGRNFENNDFLWISGGVGQNFTLSPPKFSQRSTRAGEGGFLSPGRWDRPEAFTTPACVCRSLTYYNLYLSSHCEHVHGGCQLHVD